MIGAAGAPVIVNPVGGNKISFKVIENRGANVKVKVFVQKDGQETTQAIIAENSILRIAAGRGVNGGANETPLGGPTTWDNLSTALFDTKADDMSLLPFEADFELNWKGVVAGGAPLTDGNYTLCVVAQDLDLLNSPGAAAGRTDTCVLFTSNPVPFSLDRLG